MTNYERHKTYDEAKQSYESYCRGHLDVHSGCDKCPFYSFGVLTHPCFELWLMDNRDETTTSLPASAGGRANPQSAQARPPARRSRPSREKNNNQSPKKKIRGTGF